MNVACSNKLVVINNVCLYMQVHICKNIKHKAPQLRSKFFEDLYRINSSFKLFFSEELFMYIMAMKDESIMKLVAKFCFEVLTTFDSLLE